MGLADVPVPRCKEAPAEAAVGREELVHRVASSSTFERSPRLRAFFLHVCRCALDNKPEGGNGTAGRHLRVRSAARLQPERRQHCPLAGPAAAAETGAPLRQRGQGRGDRYHHPERQVSTRLRDSFRRAGDTARCPPPEQGKSRRLLRILVGVAVLFGLVIICLGYLLFKSRSATPQASVAPAGSVARPEQSEAVQPSRSRPLGVSPRRRRSPYRRRSYRGSLCGRVGAPLGSGPLLRRRRSPAWSAAFLPPCGR